MLYKLAKFLSRLRTKQPAIFVLPGLVLGQILGSQISNILALFITLTLTLALLKAKKFLGLLAGVSFGLLSNLDIFSHRQNPEQVAIAVIGRFEPSGLRYPKPGLIQFDLKVLQVQTSEQENDRWIKSLENSVFKCQAISLPWKNINAVKVGELIYVQANFIAFKNRLLPWEFDSTLKRRGYSGKCKIRYISRLGMEKFNLLADFRATLMKRYLEVMGNDEISGLLLSLSLGVRDLISSSLERIFKDLGISHVLVLSGMQIGLMFFTTAFLIRKLLKFFVINKPALIDHLVYSIAALVSGVLVHLTYYEASATRAWIACILIALSKSAERETGILRGSIASLLLLSLIWPGCWAEAGVQLSFAALFGIAIGQELAKSKMMRIILPCLLATISTAVVSSVWFETLSTSAVIANFFIAPWFAVIGCYLGFMLVVLCYFQMPFLEEVALMAKWFMSNCLRLTLEVHKLLPRPFDLQIEYCLLLMLVFLLLCLWYFLERSRSWSREFNFYT